MTWLASTSRAASFASISSIVNPLSTMAVESEFHAIHCPAYGTNWSSGKAARLRLADSNPGGKGGNLLSVMAFFLPTTLLFYSDWVPGAIKRGSSRRDRERTRRRPDWG